MFVRLRGLVPVVRDRAELAVEIADYFDIPVRVTSGSRSYAEQSRLYYRYRRCVERGLMGLTPECAFPANAPGDSAHQFGLAFDSTVAGGDLQTWTAIREYLGFHVPGSDHVHAEVPDWRRYAPTRR